MWVNDNYVLTMNNAVGQKTIDELCDVKANYIYFSDCNAANIDFKTKNNKYAEINSGPSHIEQYRDNFALSFCKKFTNITIVGGRDGYSKYHPVLGVDWAPPNNEFADSFNSIIQKKFKQWSMDVNGYERNPDGLIEYGRNIDGNVVRIN